MPARDIAGVAGVIFVLTSAVTILAELLSSTGSPLQAIRFSAYGAAAALLVVAAVVHRREQRVREEAPALRGAGTVPAQRASRRLVRFR